MAKATIRSKSGAIITIEGREGEISNILAIFERATVVSQAKEAIARIRLVKKREKKRSTASDVVVELLEDGFFDKPKSLTEVARALEEKGHIYPVTTLSGVMLGLVQKKILRRKKHEGKWTYVK
jgi:hypothetical protein